jgi:hypothetical protein
MVTVGAGLADPASEKSVMIVKTRPYTTDSLIFSHSSFQKILHPFSYKNRNQPIASPNNPLISLITKRHYIHTDAKADRITKLLG